MNGQEAGGTQERKRIGERLIEADIIDDAQLQHALEVQKQEGGKTVELLVKLGYVDKESVPDFLATQPGIQSVDLADYEISPGLCQLIPQDFAVENELFPLEKLGNGLTVAMAFPLDSDTIERLEGITGLEVKALLCRPNDIEDAFNKYYCDDKSTVGPAS